MSMRMGVVRMEWSDDRVLLWLVLGMLSVAMMLSLAHMGW